MVEGAVNFLSLAILPKQSSEDSLSADPKDFGGHSAFASTSAFSRTSVVAFTLGLQVKSSSGARVYFLSAFHDETILDELTDEDSRVGLSNLFDLVGVHPDPLLAALQHFGSQAFLTLQTHHNL